MPTIHIEDTGRTGTVARVERVAARMLGVPAARLWLREDVAGQGSGLVPGEPGASRRAASGVAGAGVEGASGTVCLNVMEMVGRSLTIEDLAALPPAPNGLAGALRELGWECMAGVSLRSRTGAPIGALVVADTVPRRWAADELEALAELAELASGNIVAHGDPAECTDGRAMRRQAEEELRAAKEAAEDARAAAEAARAEAERASQAKTDFLSRMSHELRTPLNSVIGFANVLRTNRGNRLEEREISYLDRIITNGRHLLTIVGDLLDISRVEAGKMPVSMAMVPLAPLVRTTAAAFEADLAGRPVALLLELPDELERIETDATRLQQVLINLIGNAIKFTDGGTITVRVVADPGSARPIRLEVQDTGIGIPVHRQAAIFRAFEQAERGTTNAQGGTGLGLAISRSLCQLLGFRLGVRSAPGEGATFIVDLMPDMAVAGSEDVDREHTDGEPPGRPG